MNSAQRRKERRLLPKLIKEESKRLANIVEEFSGLPGRVDDSRLRYLLQRQKAARLMSDKKG